MKIDRLIGILSILLQREKVTAPYLAEKFEVTRRTINRDIEHLCKAGIPIMTQQGQNGGIMIMDGYKIDRMLLTSSEMQAIFTGLRSLDSIAGTKHYVQLMEKLSVKSSTTMVSGEHIKINLSSWRQTSLIPKVELFKEAIASDKQVKFVYYAPKGESVRTIEPYHLVFQWGAWYIWSYCLERQDYRLFKLNRMIEIEIIEQVFIKREVPEIETTYTDIQKSGLSAKVLFEPEVKWRLVEDYGIENFSVLDDGKLLFTLENIEKMSFFSWLLSFGAQAMILEPEQLRDEYQQNLKNIIEKYKT